MIAASLFPDQRMKGAPAPVVIPMRPETFAGLPPALQTEALLLMAEAGQTIPRMRDATGLDCADILAIGRRRHQVRAFDYERVAGEAEKAGRAAGIRRGPKLSPAARLLLGHMLNQCGALTESLTTVAYDIGVSEKSLNSALRQVVSWAFIEKVRDGTGRTAAHYRLTASGEALMADPSRPAPQAPQGEGAGDA